MHTLYLTVFIAGILATGLFLITSLTGAMGHGGHVNGGHHAGAAHAGHGHAGHDAHHGSGPDHGSAHDLQLRSWLAGSLGWALSWLSPLTLAAAALWFGAAGLLAGTNPISFVIAIVAALAGALIVRSIMRAFLRSSTAPLSQTGEGAIGTVNATIRPDAPGEVIYTLEGLHRSVPAKSVEGDVIPRGASVVITRREGGFAWVEALDPLQTAPSAPPVERRWEE